MAVWIWRGMFGNGRIAGMIIKKLNVLCGAARGTMLVSTAVAPTAAGTFRTTG